ncbi:MAG: DUF2344 domain-containing protein [Chloroflexota bacterium]
MEAPTPTTPAEPRQRWRLVYARLPSAPQLAQRDQGAAWEAGLRASGLPVVGLEAMPPRPRIAFAAPLGVGLPAERELADLLLSERLPVAIVRDALEAHLPDGHQLVELLDVWLGEAALPGQVIAADYRADVRVGAEVARASAMLTPGAEAAAALADASAALADAARRLLLEPSLLRTRDKGGLPVAYDLRPLLTDISVIEGAGSSPSVGRPATSAADVIQLRIRVRYDPQRGVGRPEEVFAALAEWAGMELSLEALVRERVVLATDH